MNCLDYVEICTGPKTNSYEFASAEEKYECEKTLVVDGKYTGYSHIIGCGISPKVISKKPFYLFDDDIMIYGHPTRFDIELDLNPSSPASSTLKQKVSDEGWQFTPIVCDGRNYVVAHQDCFEYYPCQWEEQNPIEFWINNLFPLLEKNPQHIKGVFSLFREFQMGYYSGLGWMEFFDFNADQKPSPNPEVTLTMAITTIYLNDSDIERIFTYEEGDREQEMYNQVMQFRNDIKKLIK